MITKWLNILFTFASPPIYSHEQVQYIIVASEQQHVGQRRLTEMCMLNTASCWFKITNYILILKYLLFTSDALKIIVYLMVINGR